MSHILKAFNLLQILHLLSMRLCFTCFLTIFGLLPNKTNAQSWQLFQAADTSLFVIDKIDKLENSVIKDEVVSLSFDSINYDSVVTQYHPKPLVWQNSWLWIEKPNCMVPSAWLGNTIDESNEDWTFSIDSNKFFKFSPNRPAQLAYYEPNSDSILCKLVAVNWVKLARSSTYDSVRVFRLQHYDLSTQSSFGVWNNYEIWVSKNHGIVRFPMLHFFPRKMASVELLAHKNIASHYQIKHTYERFFLDVGDVLAYKSLYTHDYGYFEYKYTEFWTVTNKEFLNDSNDIRLTFDVGRHTVGYQRYSYQEPVNYIDSISNRIEKRTFKDIHEGRLALPRTLEKFSDTNLTYYYPTERIKAHPCFGYTLISFTSPSLISDSNCLIAEGFIEWDDYSFSQVLGVGLSYFYHQDPLLGQTREYNTLVYVESDSMTCGSKPWPLGIDEISENDHLKIRLVNNNNEVMIEYPSNKFKIKLMNGSGQLLATQTSSNTKAVLDISTFGSGFYLIMVESNGGLETAKFVK